MGRALELLFAALAGGGLLSLVVALARRWGARPPAPSSTKEAKVRVVEDASQKKGAELDAATASAKTRIVDRVEGEIARPPSSPAEEHEEADELLEEARKRWDDARR